MLGTKFAQGGDPYEIAKRFYDRNEVPYVLLVAGRYDLLVEVICESQKHLKDFIFEHSYLEADIASGEKMTALET